MNTRRIKHVLVTYFTCSRTEKHAAIVLGVVLLLSQGYLFVMHHLMRPEVTPILEEERQALTTLYHTGADFQSKKSSIARLDFSSIKIQSFDPNSIDENGFVQLGMSPRQAESLIRYRDKIGGFRSKEDVKRVRVLDSGLYSHWAPFIDLPERNHPKEKYPAKPQRTQFKSPLERSPMSNTKQMVVDLNEADTILLKELPWIGSGRARAITNYRERLGGFVALEQLLEIRAIPDSVYQHILPHLTLRTGPYRRLEINRWPVDSLRHPYLGKQFARMIVAYRGQHGPYATVSDLMALPLADEEIIRKLAPYLTF